MTSSRIRVVLCSALASLLLAAGPAFAQAPVTGRETSAASVAAFGLTQQMPVDPDVVVGTLPNGLRYYVRPNPKPPNRVELRLVVKAGSVLEDEDQQGLAHFVEHMLFEGTRNFPRQGVVEFMASLGLGIGADANANTSYDETQYILRLPTDAPEVLERGLLVLHDWAQEATFDADAIERQRGIVLSEWRLRLGAGERTQDRLREVQLAGSRYTTRPPIGKPDVIERAQREQLVRFYRDWYRPNLMAVIVVGNVDRESVVAMIKERFSPLKNPTPERPRPAFDVPEQPGTRYAILADKETTTTAVAVTNLRPARRQDTVGGYREIMRDQLFGELLSARLDEIAQQEKPPFLRSAAHRSLFQSPRTKDEAVIEALVSADGVTRGLDALLTEVERVTRFGFTAPELARAKQARMVSYERSVTESPDRESASRANEYTRNFLQQEALPTIWQELAFHRRFLPEITLTEINALSAQWFPPANRLVVVSAPEAAGMTLPTQAQLAAVAKSATSKKIEPWVEAEMAKALMEAAPARGSIVRTTQRPEAGITEWTLSNGATVVLKPTTLKEDQILFRATAPGGTSLASDADAETARVTADVIAAGGVRQFNASTLDKMLTGKAVVVSPFLTEISQGMAGGSTPQDLETMFQLLHLRFTQPRADPVAFAAFASQVRGLLANQLASPDVVFEQTLDSALSRDHVRRRPLTPATVDRWDLAKALAFYKARFADASNFTFVFTGSFTPEMLKPLVETYVASLPATRAGESWRDLGISPPRGVVEKSIEKGIAPKSQVAIVFSGPFVYSDANVLALRAMTMVLESRLFESIRQELGGTYTIGADPANQKFPTGQFSVRIEWACDPARTASLVQRVFDEIRAVRETVYTPGQVTRIQAALLRQVEQNSQNNGYLLSEIARRYDHREAANVAAAVNQPAQIAELTGEAIRQAALTYLDLANYVKVTLMPEVK